MTDSDHRLRFAAAVSYRASTPEGLARQKLAIAQAAASGLDSDTLFELIGHHRTGAIALAILEATGQEEVLGSRIEDLRRSAQTNRQRSLVLAMRGEQARRAIERAGVRCLNFKGGPNLSRKLYGDLALRHCKDVDLIVHPENLAVAIDALKGDGWTTDLSPVWFATPHHRGFARFSLREIAFLDSSTGCQVELHTRFEHIPDPAIESIWWRAMPSAPRQDLSEAEFLFLVTHGTKHLWNRMKWLGDIAAVVESRPGLVHQSAPLAKELKLERTFAPLAALLHDLHGMELPGFAVSARERHLASPCIAALRRKEMWELTPVEEAIDGQRNNKFRLSIFGPRVPLSRRISFLLLSLLIRPGDIEAMGPFHWSLLPFLPLVRFASLMGRYTQHILHPVPGGAHK